MSRKKLRRHREKKTDYRKRLDLIKSGNPRVVIRRSNSQIITQIVEYNPDGDKTVISKVSNHLKEYGWDLNTGNLPAAYLTGYLCGVKAQEKFDSEQKFTLDLGLEKVKKGTRIFAALKGFVDSELNINHDRKVFPAEERVKGQHIEEYYSSDQTNYTLTEPENITKKVEQVKNKIKGEG